MTGLVVTGVAPFRNGTTGRNTTWVWTELEGARAFVDFKVKRKDVWTPAVVDVADWQTEKENSRVSIPYPVIWFGDDCQ